jgi:predicted cobalt transporter CbtA
MFAAYLTRGVKAGIVAGIVFGLFVALVANPLVVYADERHHAHAASGSGDGAHVHGAHDAATSTVVDKAVSVVSSGLWAVLLGGGFFGIAFYLLEPVVPGTGATKSYVFGAAGFVTVSGAPWLVLPPVSPGAQQSIPAGTRLLLYGGMVVAGALVCLLAAGVYNRLRRSNGHAVAVVGGVLPFGLLAIPAVVAPTNAVQGSLSPTLRTGLVGLFVFGQVLLWLVLAATHARFRSGDGSRAERTATTRLGAD